MRLAAALGLAVVGAHAVAFATLADRCHGTPLVIEVSAARAAPRLTIEGRIPPALADRIIIDDRDAAAGPGLHRRRWAVRYRGGFEHAVGAAQLVGPFQDPAAHTCTGRVVVGQRLLDDGAAGPGTVAGELARTLAAELAGQDVFGAGAYQRIAGLALRWARLEWHPYDRGFIGDAPHGYVRAELRVVFARVEVPLVIALVPEPTTTALAFRVVAHAELAFDNRVAQWLSDRLGGDRLATHLTRRQLDGALLATFAPPPPFELPGGHQLRFTFCAEPPEILEGVSGALPFAIEFGPVGGAMAAVLPPRRGRAPRLAATSSLALDLDLDALNALLYELWRTGFLDRTLADAGLDARFNTDPIVAEFLTLRISPITLALPPVLAPTPHGLRLAADARVTITDRDRATIGRAWGGLDLAAGQRGLEPIAVDLSALELSCERTPTTLVPCYAELVAAIRDRGPEFHGVLSTTFTKLLADLFVDRRLGGAGLPADLVIQRAVPRITTSATNGSLHLDLDATLAPAR